MNQQQIDERGNHALVFFSLILALSVTNLIEAWAKSLTLGLQPKNILQTEGLFLVSMSILSFQYWWVIYRSRSFYGEKLLHFVLGVGENVALYALTMLLRDLYSKGLNATPEQRSYCFLLFIIIVGLYILSDCICPHDTWKSRRQAFRVAVLVFAVVGWFIVDESIRTVMAGFIACVMIGYTIDNTLTT
jgi:hypothetical protein